MTGKDIRLLVSDIDGTLVRDDKSLSESVVDAVRRLRSAGIGFSLISARPPTGMSQLVERLKLSGPFGAFGGGTIFEADGSILSSAQIDPVVAQDMVALLEAAGVAVWLFANSRWYAHDDTNPHCLRERISSGLAPTLRRDFADLLDHADKIMGVDDDLDLMQTLQMRAKSLVNRGGTIVRSQPYFLDLTAPQANKGEGVAAIAKAAGVPLANVAVIGDMPNDLPMFKRPRMAIAMGQAPQVVRSAADMVTASNEHDGVALAIDRILACR